MSVNQQIVVIKGCDIGCDAYDKYNIDDCMEEYDEEYNEKKNSIVIFNDGMNGDYCFVGIVAAITDKYEPLGADDFGVCKIESVDKETIAKIQKFIYEKFKIENAEIDNYVFMHCS